MAAANSTVKILARANGSLFVAALTTKDGTVVLEACLICAAARMAASIEVSASLPALAVRN